MALHRQPWHEVGRGLAVQLAKLRQLDGIYLPLPSFEPGNERLLEAKVFSNGFLGYARFHSGGTEPFEK